MIDPTDAALKFATPMAVVLSFLVQQYTSLRAKQAADRLAEKQAAALALASEQNKNATEVTAQATTEKLDAVKAAAELAKKAAELAKSKLEETTVRNDEKLDTIHGLVNGSLDAVKKELADTRAVNERLRTQVDHLIEIVATMRPSLAKNQAAKKRVALKKKISK